jgi:hypothetical protein
LCGSRLVTDISCLAQLSTISHLDISSCDLGAQGGFHLAGVIKDMGALLVLDVSNNGLTQGKLLQEKTYDSDGDTDDEEEHEEIDLSGVVALANGIKDMSMTSLSLASNSLGVEGAKIIAAVLPKCT